MAEDTQEPQKPSPLKLLYKEIKNAPEKIKEEQQKTGNTDWLELYGTRLTAVKGFFEMAVKKGELPEVEVERARANLEKLLKEISEMRRIPNKNLNPQITTEGIDVVSINGLYTAKSILSEDRIAEINSSEKQRAIIEVQQEKRDELLSRLNIFKEPQQRDLQQAA
jgi:hypothetical protein